LQFAAPRHTVAVKQEERMGGRLAGKKVFITGGAQGLGAAMAKGVASEGAKVAVTDINKGGAEKRRGRDQRRAWRWHRVRHTRMT
jgi:NAD(P)-dependent dehydrogenase (short-subunit alcohol dehydrogenase family)